MSRPRGIDPLLVAQAQETAATATSATSVVALRRCQAVLLPALLGATFEQTAAALGVCRATVPRLQAAFRLEKTPHSKPPPTWGGRRRALLIPLRY